MLEVRLLGTFAIQCDGQPITISSRTAQSLFAYLILNAGTKHRREKLAGMFWPDATEEKARAHLRHELWRIRKALSTSSKVDYLIADDINVSFNASPEYWLDVANLENVNETASIEELMDGLSIFQGELLPGFYDDWVTPEREHLQALNEQKMARLLALLENEKRWDEILEWAERWITVGQQPETAYRYLMIAYDALDDRAKVSSTYSRCVKALRELALEPSEQTRALAFKRTPKLNIPIPLTSFIGREKEIKEIAALFSKSRLITLIGSGGVGKTRLSIQVVAAVLELFPDGVWFIALDSLSDPALVPQTVASVFDIRESQKQPVIEILKDVLRQKTALLIFDNCEHLPEACAQLITALLMNCPNLAILATSRETLHVAGEAIYLMPSLALPEHDTSLDELSEYESVKLFAERAALAVSSFTLTKENIQAVVDICRRVDGIPLAIELAAARVNILNVAEILKQLQDSFSLLAGGGRLSIPRHQTLRASMDWSWGLLSEAEQIFLRQLSIFAGGWTLESAQAVCDGDALSLTSALVNKSLIAVDLEAGRETRYRFHEIVRQYTRERLIEAGNSELVRDRHLAYFVKLAERAEPELVRYDQVRWLNRLWDELDNLRMAIEWALATNIESGLRLIVSPWLFWEWRGDVRELEGWLAQLLEQYRGVDALRARALVIYSRSLWYREDFAKARVIAEQGLELSRAISDQSAEAFSLWGLGAIIGYQSYSGQNIPIREESLALYRSLKDKFGQAQVLTEIGGDLAHNNPFDNNLLLESLKLYRKLGHLSAVAACLCDLAHMAIRGGDFSSPVQWLAEAHMLNRQLGSQAREAHVSQVYGLLAYWQGDFDRARAYFEEAIALNENSGRYRNSWTHASMAYAILRQGDTPRAKKIFGFCIQQFQKADNINGLAFTIEGLASLHVNQKQPERAARLFAWVDTMREKINYPRPPVEQASVERDLAMIHAQISDTAFVEACKSGKTMTLEEAVAFALEEK